MTFTLDGVKIRLDNTEVRSCRELVGRWMKEVDRKSTLLDQPTYYFTFLIIMNLFSQEALAALDAQRLSEVMDAYREQREKNRRQDRGQDVGKGRKQSGH